MGWAAGEHNIVVYKKDGRISGHNAILVHMTLMVVVRIFYRVGLKTNLGNTKAMVCTPSFIWGKQGSAAYNQRVAGEGDTSREQNKTRVSCEECGRLMAASSLCHHMETAHGISMKRTQGIDVGVGEPKTYVVYFPQVLNLVTFQVDGCPMGEHNMGRLM